jgi:hypothetical protein
MGVRKKGTARFEYLGEYFHWYCDDNYIRVYSEDKTFVIAYPLDTPLDETPHLEIHGQRFPGIERDERRPVLVCVPPLVEETFSRSMGAFVNALIRWSLNDAHRLKYFESNHAGHEDG